MTQPDGLFPAGAFNFDSLAELAARPQSEWEAMMRGQTSNGFELVISALFGGLPPDLQEGIAFTQALITAIVRRILNLPGQVWGSVEDALADLNAWAFGIPADVQAKINEALGNMQDALDGTYTGTDPVLLAVQALAQAWLTATSPLNSGNLFGRIALPQFGSGVPLMALTTAVPNELEPFSATSVPTADGWSWNAAQDAAQVVCDGSTKALYLKSGVIKVEEGQPLDTSIDVKYSGIVSGVGQTIRYVLETFTTDDGSGTATPVIVGAVTNPTGTITTPVTLGDSSWDIPPGVKSVRPVLEGDELITAGTVFWLNTPELFKKLAGPLSDGLPAAIQARINDIQATWDAFKGGAGGTVDDIEDALDGAGQAIRDAIANALGHSGTGHTSANILTYLQNIPQTVVSGLGDLNTLTNQIRDILAGLVVTPINSTVAAIKDWFTGVLGKTQNLTSGGTLPPTSVTGVGGAANIAEAVEETWNKFWDGINRTVGSTGKTTADVLTAATQVADTADSAQSTADTAQGSTIYLQTLLTLPRYTQRWVSSGPQDDASFPVVLINQTVTPSLGQLVLIPVTAETSRTYESVKFGLAGSTMTNLFVGLYSYSSGTWAMVADLGDVKASLSGVKLQAFNMASAVSVTRGQTLYIGVLQVGGTAAAMHAGPTMTTGMIEPAPEIPTWVCAKYGTGLSSLPSSFSDGSVSEQNAPAWGALGTEVGAPTIPPPVFYSDNFNRSNGVLTAPWVKLGGGDSRVFSNTLQIVSSGSSLYKYGLPFNTLDQRVKFAVYTNSSDYKRLILRLKDADNYMALGIAGGSTDAWQITTTIGGTTTVRKSGSRSFSGFVPVEFRAVGNVYALYVSGALVDSWTDSGGLFAYGNTNNSSGFRFESASAQMDDFEMADNT